MFRPILLLALATFGAAAIAADAPKLNVLFIAVDDLNHWVAHLGRNPQTKTPNPAAKPEHAATKAEPAKSLPKEDAAESARGKDDAEALNPKRTAKSARPE